jgi:ATP-dependent DNA ligase
MDARLVDQLPTGGGWQYEPKWDGFRCLVFRDGRRIQLQSKSGQPLARYFPELVEAVAAIRSQQFVLDSEIVIPIGNRLSFDHLLMRIHPAQSRVLKLAAEHPAMMVVFDLLADDKGTSIVSHPLRERRRLLDRFAARYFPRDGLIRLSPATEKLATAKKWFQSVGTGLDGVIAKQLDSNYRSGDREGMRKVKRIRTVDCVAGGFRYGVGRRIVGSLLLGLYDREGLLHHVGFTSNISAAERLKLTRKLELHIKPPGFTGRAPGAPSRWSNKRSTEWQPLAPKLVVEVQYDHFTGGRFRHGTKFLRWRPDKAPKQCTMDQLEARSHRPLRLLKA